MRVVNYSPKFLKFYSIDLVDFITLFLRQINKKLKFKDLKINSEIPLSAKIITNFSYHQNCNYQDIFKIQSTATFLYKGKYYALTFELFDGGVNYIGECRDWRKWIIFTKN